MLLPSPRYVIFYIISFSILILILFLDLLPSGKLPPHHKKRLRDVHLLPLLRLRGPITNPGDNNNEKWDTYVCVLSPRAKMTVYRRSGPRLFFFFFFSFIYLFTCNLFIVSNILLLREFEVEEMN